MVSLLKLKVAKFNSNNHNYWYSL